MEYDLDNELEKALCTLEEKGLAKRITMDNGEEGWKITNLGIKIMQDMGPGFNIFDTPTVH